MMSKSASGCIHVNGLPLILIDPVNGCFITKVLLLDHTSFRLQATEGIIVLKEGRTASDSQTYFYKLDHTLGAYFKAVPLS